VGFALSGFDQKQIAGFEIAVDHALSMGMIQGFKDIQQQRQRDIRSQRAF